MKLTAILVPLDGSALSEAAVPYAAAIARATDAPLRLLAVVTSQAGGMREAEAEHAAHFEQMEEKHLENYLAAQRDALQQRGVAATASVRRGQPVEAILAAGDEPGADMIIMATAGRGGLERWAVGSVADKVMRLCRKPVLLVRPRDERAGHRAVELRRLLVPLDGSALAETALPLAGDLAAALGAHVTLLQAVALPPVWPAGAEPDLGGVSALLLDEAREYLRAAARHLPPAVPFGVATRWGGATQAIEDVVAREAIDLVVMTTHGRGGLSRLILGSTADRTVRAGVPTLLIPAQETQGQA